MAVIRANWHLDHLFRDDGSDPLALNEQGRLEEVGKAIDLTAETSVLRQQLLELLGEEEALYNAGTRCEIKDLDCTCCSVCPLRGTHGRLCEVGVAQETLETTLAVAAHSGTA